MPQPASEEAQDAINSAAERFDTASNTLKEDMFLESLNNAVNCPHCALIAAVGKMSSQHANEEHEKLKIITELIGKAAFALAGLDTKKP